jgi:hypothetical protein
MATGRVPTTANSPLTAKGDLFTYSTAPARLAVGNNGETIVADSSTSTGLRYNPTYAAGKNAVINGSMTNWQRGTSFTSTGYTADRWYLTSPGSNTVSRSTDTPSGFTYSLKWDMTGGFPLLSTYVELPATGVKGQYTGSWTASFWAKGSGSYTLDFEAAFNNGSNRIDRVGIGSNQTISLTTTWTKYSYTFDLTSPTINANNKAIELIFYSTTGTRSMYLTGFQFEPGSVATGFSLAGGTIQGELAACKRYLPSVNVATAGTATFFGYAYATNSMITAIPFDVQARVSPTGITVNPTLAGNYVVRNKTNGDATITSLTFDAAGVSGATVLAGATLTQGDAARLICGSGFPILFTGCEL